MFAFVEHKLHLFQFSKMKVRPEDPAKLSDFKLLSFDCFGTLVDWECMKPSSSYIPSLNNDAAGIYEELKPLLNRLPSSNPVKNDRDLAVKKFNEIEVSLCASEPGLKYSLLIEKSYERLAESMSLPPPIKSEVEAVGASISKWPAFPDTIAALQRLQKHYKLAILSNVDKESFDQVLASVFKDVKFDAVYVAEEIGSYKPDLNNFRYLLEHVKGALGVEKKQVLHIAHGIKADHVPSKEIGLTSAWIQRNESTGPGSRMEEVKDKVAFTWQFNTMGEMADAVDQEYAKASK